MEDTKYAALDFQLKKITEQLGFLEKKVDQLLAARVEPKPFVKSFSKPYGQKPYGQKPYGQKPYGQKPYGQKPFGGPNRYGGPREGQGGSGSGFKRTYSNNQGRTRTAFYEGGAKGGAQGAPAQGHFKKKFAPNRPHRPS